MLLNSLSPRSLAKFTASAAVSIGTKLALDTALDSFTDVDTDSFPVDLTTTVTGAVVAVKLMPVTDAAVDVVADRRVARKIAKQNKTETPES